MRIGDFAQAARTTPRTVRHYHQLGLLPEPDRRANGYRDYDLADLLRLLRITWLTKAGVPLAKIGELLADDDPVPNRTETGTGSSTDAGTETGDSQPATNTTVEHDLAIVAQTIRAERDRLSRQLAALDHIRESVRQGARLTSLPAELAHALDRVAAAAEAEARADGNDVTRASATIERDREMLEVMALSGELPDELVTAYGALADDPQQLRQALRIATAFSALEGQPPASVDAEIDELVEQLLQAPVVRQLLSGFDQADLPESQDPAFFVPDPAQREVALRLMRRLS